MKIEKMRERLTDGECALIMPGSNLFYLTGIQLTGVHERLFVLLITKSDEPAIVAPQIYENELKGWTWELHLWKDGEDPVRVLRYLIKERNSERILVEDHAPASLVLALRDMGELELLGRRMKELRVRKDSEEIERIEKACLVVDKVFEELISTGFEKKRESEIAKRIDERMLELGCAPSFETIVASGANAAEPHHTVSEKRIERGELVVMDYGARLDGYCSDITRTVAVGEKKSGEIYEVVREAQQSAFESACEGATAEEIDRAARDVITERGYGKNFTHRTGHGLGIEVHEEPYITQGNRELLKEGMVFTIEPGIYLKGHLGIRIEDDVAIINGKGVRLTSAERELFVV